MAQPGGNVGHVITRIQHSLGASMSQAVCRLDAFLPQDGAQPAQGIRLALAAQEHEALAASAALERGHGGGRQIQRPRPARSAHRLVVLQQHLGPPQVHVIPFEQPCLAWPAARHGDELDYAASVRPHAGQGIGQDLRRHVPGRPSALRHALGRSRDTRNRAPLRAPFQHSPSQAYLVAYRPAGPLLLL